MAYRVAVLAIIIQDPASIPQLNRLLHDYAPYIVGRLGLPYRQRRISVISVVMDAPQDVINALSGKIGRLSGVTGKTAYSNVSFEEAPEAAFHGEALELLSEEGPDGRP